MRLAATSLAVLAMSGQVSAACLENLGRTGCTDGEVFPRADLRRLSCQNLWYVRNLIYHENGYCFRTARGMATFDNDGCSVDDAAQVKLNHFERQNVRRIAEIEKQKSCPR